MTQAQITKLKDRLTTLKSTHLGNLNRRVGNLESKVSEIQYNLKQIDDFTNTFLTEIEQKLNAELAAITAQVSSGSYLNNTLQADLNNASRRRKKRQKTKRRKGKRKGTRKKS